MDVLSSSFQFQVVPVVRSVRAAVSLLVILIAIAPILSGTVLYHPLHAIRVWIIVALFTYPFSIALGKNTDASLRLLLTALKFSTYGLPLLALWVSFNAANLLLFWLGFTIPMLLRAALLSGFIDLGPWVSKLVFAVVNVISVTALSLFPFVRITAIEMFSNLTTLCQEKKIQKLCGTAETAVLASLCIFLMFFQGWIRSSRNRLPFSSINLSKREHICRVLADLLYQSARISLIFTVVTLCCMMTLGDSFLSITAYPIRNVSSGGASVKFGLSGKSPRIVHQYGSNSCMSQLYEALVLMVPLWIVAACIHLLGELADALLEVWLTQPVAFEGPRNETRLSSFGTVSEDEGNTRLQPLLLALDPKTSPLIRALAYRYLSNIPHQRVLLSFLLLETPKALETTLNYCIANISDLTKNIMALIQFIDNERKTHSIRNDGILNQVLLLVHRRQAEIGTRLGFWNTEVTVSSIEALGGIFQASQRIVNVDGKDTRLDRKNIAIEPMCQAVCCMIACQVKLQELLHKEEIVGCVTRSVLHSSEADNQLIFANISQLAQALTQNIYAITTAFPTDFTQLFSVPKTLSPELQDIPYTSILQSYLDFAAVTFPPQPLPIF